MRRCWLALAFLLCACDLKIKSEAKDFVSLGLKDPSSAQFQNLRVAKFDGEDAVCGEVNGKNAFGAYVGFKTFVYIRKPYSEIIEVPDKAPILKEVRKRHQKAYAMVCHGMTEQEYSKAEAAAEKDLDKIKAQEEIYNLEKLKADSNYITVEEYHEIVAERDKAKAELDYLKRKYQIDHIDITPFDMEESDFSLENL